MYIIEDIEQNYWYQGNSYGYDHKFGIVWKVNFLLHCEISSYYISWCIEYLGKDHPKSVMTVFKKMVDVVNREFSSSKVEVFAPYLVHNICLNNFTVRILLKVGWAKQLINGFHQLLSGIIVSL